MGSLHLNDKTITTRSTFSGFIDQLLANFIRTHKSFSVNLNKLSENQITVDSHKISIRKTYKAQVLKALNI